jgi:hypothetical protein
MSQPLKPNTSMERFFFKKEAQLEKQNEVADTETWSKEPWVVPPHDLLLRA